MITFIALLIALFVLAVITVIGGSVFLLIFADAIVFGLIIWIIYKVVTKMKK